MDFLHNTFSQAFHFVSLSLSRRYARLLLPAVLMGIVILDPAIRPVIAEALADAYIAVGVFVALTLLAYYVAQQQFGWDISRLAHKSPIYQIVVAAILGALPGCGGAIIVVSQYAAGRVGFAALVTVLVSTMGDAAFLLLAKDPKTGLLVIATGLLVGIFSGWIVSVIHDADFLRKPRQNHVGNKGCVPLVPYPPLVSRIWVGILLLAVPLTVLSSFQVDIADRLFATVDMTVLWGVLGALLCVMMWAVLPLHSPYRGFVAEDHVAAEETTSPAESPEQTPDILSRVIHDTNFIMVWVTMAFLLFEVIVYYTHANLTTLFGGITWLAPLFGVVIGFLPGCGPQIIVAGLYLQGIVPLSTLLGNAISNDGDALFPAIALTPKAALIATVYSAVPALLVAYAVFFIRG